MAVSNSHLLLSIVTIGIIGIIYVPSTAGSPAPAVCDAGQRLQGATCLPCDPGTFMPVNSHTYTRCFQCDRVIPGSWESVLKPCTRTTDIQKICEPGVAFRFRERVCATCTICLHGEVETRPCTEHSDRECSPRTTPAPAVCDAGQHLQGDTCVPCEPGSYMSEKSHTHTQCFQCDRVLRGSWESVKEPCTRTTNIQTICLPGVAFRFHELCKMCTTICLHDEVETRPCTEHSNRQCAPRSTNGHDTKL